jgi:hypothetical protein
MTATPRTDPTILSSHNIPIQRLKIFHPKACVGCPNKARLLCGSPAIAEPPRVCPNALVHALLCDFEVGYFESKRRSGKTTLLVNIADVFEDAGLPVTYIVPVLSYAQSVRNSGRLRNANLVSLNSLDSRLRGRGPSYVFVDEVRPHEMDEGAWSMLACGQHVFVAGYFTSPKNDRP